ncbi:MAG: hypothetical protein EZS28_036371 [Streblomastix strix]|uniref:Integrase catalytic domain-containing protein n=1 Tax=Streblomastix strix TaxID=222440 RepID=A0A5J4UDX8_9EUKA|nr:MAG: hypothetical protein EZS28_036371 [Streblomastix strix]
MPFESLSANITVVIDALESLHIDWHAIFKTIWEAAIKYACESKLYKQIDETATDIQNQLTHLANTNNGIMKFAQFVSNMKITPSRLEQDVLINRAEEIQIGGKTLLEWFEIYQTEAEKYNPPLRRIRSIRSQANEQIMKISQPPAATLLLFPFKSKVKQYEKINQIKITQETQIKDIKTKPLNKLQRPYFSPKLGSWEIDLVFGVNPVTRRRQHYLFAININTKYLVVIPLILDEKNATYILAALKKLINQMYVNNIRGDGETGFKANIVRQFCEDNRISLYFTGSPYTQHNRVVDSVIRTIRNGFGQDLQGFATPSQMQQMVEIYNKTPHLAFMNRFTPKQVQYDREIEGKFIRQKQAQLEQVMIRQQQQNLLNFKSGNILMIHADYARLPIRFQKQRRQFNELATFINYKNGNVVCKLLNSYDKISVIELPIYYSSETKQIRKRQSKKPVPQLVETQSSPIDEVLHAPLIDQTVNPIQQTQLNEEKIEQRGRPKKYCSQEEAERIAAEQRSRAQQKYRIQRQEFRATANDLQLLLIRRLQKTIITNIQDLLQISEIIDQYNQ